jgi:hypothetical protein
LANCLPDSIVVSAVPFHFVAPACLSLEAFQPALSPFPVGAVENYVQTMWAPLRPLWNHPPRSSASLPFSTIRKQNAQLRPQPMAFETMAFAGYPVFPHG